MGHSSRQSSKAQALSAVSSKTPSNGKATGKSRISSRIMPAARMTTYTRPPSAWPSSIPFLSTVHLDKSITPAHVELFHPLHLPATDSYIVQSQCVFSPTSNPLISIENIKSSSHPAYPQSGLFATRHLPPGTHILDYTGLLHSCPLSSCSTSDYDLAFLERDASLAIDGANMGNEARFINDYHGIREGPNAVFEEYFVKVKGAKGKDVWEARMGVWVNPACAGGIGKGEEICLSYGKGYWRARMATLADLEGEVDVVPEEENTTLGQEDASTTSG